MRIATKLSIALALAMALSIVGPSVWAAHNNRQGTVTNAAHIIPVTGNIPVTGGTFQATLLGDCKAKGTITRIADPATEVGPIAIGFSFLTDGIKVALDKPCDIQICYPYPTEYEDLHGGINAWDSFTRTWGVIESTISGDPKQICSIIKGITNGSYGLIGK